MRICTLQAVFTHSIIDTAKKPIGLTAEAKNIWKSVQQTCILYRHGKMYIVLLFASKVFYTIFFFVRIFCELFCTSSIFL